MKNKKIKHRLYLVLIGALTLFSAFVLFSIAFLQSDWMKNKAKTYVVDYLKKNNLPITIDKIEGLPPLYWVVKGVEIPFEDQQIVIDEITLRISFLALAKKEVSLRHFHVKNVSFKKVRADANALPSKATASVPLTPPEPPLFDLSIKQFKIENFHIDDQTFNLIGHAFLEKKARSFALNTTIYSHNFKENILWFKTKGSEKIHRGYFTLLLKKPSFYFISPKLKDHLTNDTKIAIFLKGSYEDIKTLIFEQKLPNAMKGSLHGLLALEKLPSEIKGDLILNNDFSASLSNFSLKNGLLSAEGSLSLNSAFDIDKMHFDLNAQNLAQLKELYNLPIKGTLKTTVDTDKEQVNFSLSTKNLVIDRHPIKNLEGKIKGIWKDSIFRGSSSLTLLALEDNLNFKSIFEYNFKQDYLELEKCRLIGSDFSLKSSKFNILKNGLMQGKVQLAFSNLRSLETLYPQAILKSAGEFTFDFMRFQEKQNVKIGGTFKDYHLNYLLGSKLFLSADIQNLFQTPVGNLKFNGTDLTFHDLKFNKFEGTSYSSNKGGWDFVLSASGLWRTPVNCNLVGNYSYAKGQTNLKIINFSGKALTQSFYLKKPTAFSWKDQDHFTLSDFEFMMPTSSLQADIKIDGANNQIKVLANHFPLDFFSFNPLELKTTGFASCDFTLNQSSFNIDSTLKLNIEDSTIAAVSDEHPLKIQGEIESKITNGLLSATCDLKSGQNGLLALNLSLPLKVGKSLFHFDILQQKDLKAKVAYEGRVEDLLDFFNLKHNRLEGDLFCQLTLSKNLINPQVEGFLKLENGIFENYHSGSYFQNISADISFAKSKMIIEKLQAYDLEQKPLTASGALTFNKLLNYPYALKCTFDSTQIMKSDFIDAKADGEIEIKGNLNKGLIKGKVEINSGLITIPEEIPLIVPAIPTTYINQKKETVPRAQKAKQYPIFLDLELNMPKNIFVKGRGVDAELEGHIYLTGSLDDIISSGRLNVAKGSYSFSGKTFELIDSRIIFPGIKGAFPELAITGQVEQGGIVINANLKGPLNAPKLYFTSSPSLPLGSILSLLLFGQEISGISALQALQVANTISSLSGDNNVLEAAKKKLGIDRLAVIATSSEENEDPDQVAILIGKYIMKNVLLSFSRGFDYGVTNIIVEVDFFKGVFFQFETMMQEQQNKFTLKWKHNY